MKVKRQRVIRRDGKIATLRRARKQHSCKYCPAPIFSGEHYWEIVLASSGLGSTKFPTRVHVGACYEKEFGGK